MNKPFIVAEMSANHNGSKQTAIETIKAAKRAGADAIKLQTYRADTITMKCNKPDFIINNHSIWDGQYYYDLYLKAYTPWEWHEELFRVAREEGLVCFSSPFDKTAIDLLESLGCPIGGPDCSFSMEEKDFAQMVKDVRMAASAIGTVNYERTAKMEEGRRGCRSLYVAEDMKSGDIITERNVRSVRPGFGLHPKYFKTILGKTINRDLERGERMKLEYVSLS